MSASGLTLRNTAGRAIRMTGLIWDITDSQRVQRMKNEFVATVSHELRTPLTSIRGSLGLVAAGVAGKLPERAGSLVNMALNNCERLQVMANLLSNASKFSPSGAAIEITARCIKGGVRVAVRDHGKGIPPDFQPRIFQKFSQADSSDSRSLAGTGLGLAISRAIVERLGGHIGFDTGPGGSTFFFELPDANGIAAQTSALTQSKVS